MTDAQCLEVVFDPAHQCEHRQGRFAAKLTARRLRWSREYGAGASSRRSSSISHPFAALVVTFRFLEEMNELLPGDPWFARLCNAYLETWGRGLAGAFALAMRVGSFARTFAYERQRDHLPKAALADFDSEFGTVLRRAIATVVPGIRPSAAALSRARRK